MNYNQTIYKETLYMQIREILGDPKNFIKSNKGRRKSVNDKLSELCILANHTSIFNINNYRHKNLNDEYDLFKKLFEDAFNKTVERINSSGMNRKFDVVIDFLISYLANMGYINKNHVTNSRVRKKISSDQIFNICILSATSLLKYDYQLKDVDPGFNEILHVKFVKSLSKNLLMHIGAIILHNNIQASGALKVIIDHASQIVIENVCLVELSYQISGLFEECAISKTRYIRFNGDIKSYKVIEISHKLLSEHIIPTHMPRIIEPDNTYDNIDDYYNLSKPISNGLSRVTMSTATRDALIISHKKRFRINPDAINLFKLIDEMPYDVVKNIDSLPFTPIKHLEHMSKEIDDMLDNISDEISDKIRSEFRDIKSKKSNYNPKEMDIASFISNKTRIDINTINIHMDYYKKVKILKERKRLRCLHNTTIKFAELFIDFPIYFVNTYDYRLRMYPYSYFFSRTTGMYKYLVSEFELTKVSPEGYINMVIAYTKNFPIQYEYLGDICVERIDYIKEHFKPLNIEDLFEKSSYFYYALLGNEIYKLRDENKTNFLIEIDQKSSSCVFMSILLGHAQLAQKCNLMSKDFSDPAIILMNRSHDYYNGKISDESLKIISLNRRIHKSLLMCFCYNQTLYGRSIDLRNYLSLDSDINYISTTYPDFINNVFNNISIKRDSVNNIVKYYLENSEDGIIIDTLDGSRVSWFMFTTKKHNNGVEKRKFKSAITEENISYSLKTYDTNTIDMRKIILGLLPSLIHSIDGAIMRMIIVEVNTRYNYTINHLHDSIQFHPNQYRNILEAISEVYTNNNLESCIDRCLFNNMSNNLLVEKKVIFDKMVTEFKSYNYKKISVTKETFDPSKMYPFE